MVLDVLAAPAGEDGTGGTQWGLLLLLAGYLVVFVLPAVASVAGGVLLMLGFIRRSDHKRAGTPPRQDSGTVLIASGGVILAIGLLGMAAPALL